MKKLFVVVVLCALLVPAAVSSHEGEIHEKASHQGRDIAVAVLVAAAVAGGAFYLNRNDKS